jgi:hypothetical protein
VEARLTDHTLRQVSAYTGPASRAYLYYTDEYKNWAPGLKVSITPR